MLHTFLITFGLMLLVIMMMAIGYLIQKKKIKGSCGGISDLGMDKVCDCDEPCDKRKELMKRMQEEKRLESQIDIKMIDD